jgi:hypothetical protein
MKTFSEHINENKIAELGAIGVTLKSADLKDADIAMTAKSLTTESVIIDIAVKKLTGDQLMILCKGGLKHITPSSKGFTLTF